MASYSTPVVRWSTTSRAPPARGATTGTPDRPGLAQRVAVGLVLTGVDQQVEGRQRHRQVADAERAGEAGVGETAGQPLAVRSGADDDEADAGDLGQRRETSDAGRLVEAAGVPDDDLAAAGLGAGPGLVQPRVAQRGGEGERVDARLPQARRDPELGGPAHHPRRGDQDPVGALGDLGPPVVGGQVEHGRLLDGERRDAGASGVLERLAAHGSGGVDLHQVGREPLDRVAHLRAGRLQRPDPHDLALLGSSPAPGPAR